MKGHERIAEILAELMKKADENTQNRGITDYDEAVADNAKYLVSRGVTVRQK